MVRFQVLTAAHKMMSVLWRVTACSPAEVYLRFRGTCCLLYQGVPHYITENHVQCRVLKSFIFSRQYSVFTFT
jgi:hypothetical protein